MNYKILSVGGSIIIPKTGFDINFLKKFKQLILDRVKKGEKFILVIGGGATCRDYQQALSSVVPTSNVDLDWLGIHSTWFNAEFVRLMFGEFAYKEIIINPTKKIKTSRPIIVAGGWKPGCSTDKDAVLLAKTYGAKELLNLSNIEYVFDRDPNKFSDAKKIENISWADFRKNIVGFEWVPGKNVPFDPVASALAQKLKLCIGILQGTNLSAVENALVNKKFIGTIVCDSVNKTKQ